MKTIIEFYVLNVEANSIASGPYATNEAALQEQKVLLANGVLACILPKRKGEDESDE